MRFKSAVVLLMIVVIGTTTFPVTGQEEPLPAIQAKGSLAPLTPSIVLPAEQADISLPPQTLEGAARANDFITFDALYREAMRRGQSAAAFSTLYELWTYGITDPVGAFYDGDIYDRLSRAYPGYASYIAQYRIVDSNGHVFYPTSETRAFLLERALDGDTPNVQLVEGGRTTQRVEVRETNEGSVWSGHTTATARNATTRTTPRRRTTTSSRRGTATATPRRTETRTTAAPAERKSSTSRSTSPKPAAVASTPASAPATKAPVVAEKAPEPAPVVETQPVVSESSSTPTTTVATTSAEPPVVVRPEPAAAAPVVETPVTAPQPVAAENRFGGRGILLLLIGLVGVGLLAMMLRAPKEVPTSIMPNPSNGPDGDKGPGEKASGPVPVEPLRRPSAAPPPPPPPPGKNRAGGSHG